MNKPSMFNIDFDFDFEQVEEDMDTVLEKGMELALIDMVNRAKIMVSRGNRSGDNPSDPYEPWKTVTGRGRSSIDYMIMTDPIRGAFGTNVEYLRHLEFGTRDMLPRPVFRPVLFKNMDRFLEFMVEPKA